MKNNNEKPPREGDERFRSIFRTAATGIAISTPAGRYLEANAAYCRMLGYTQDELRALNFAAVTHPDDIARNLALRDELLAGQRDRLYMEKRYLTKGGGVVWASISVSATHAASGEIATLIVVAQDITEHKRAEEDLRLRNAQLQALFDLTPAMLFLKDTENRFLRVNQLAALSVGKPVDELEGRSAYDVFPLEADKYYVDDLKVIRSRAPVLGIVETLRDGAGEPRWVHTDKVPLFDLHGDVSGILVMARDITEQKRAAEHAAWSSALARAMDNSVLDGLLVVSPQGRKILQSRRLIELFKIPKEIAADAEDGRRSAWIAAQMKDPKGFAERAAHLYAHPDETRREELELADGRSMDLTSVPVRGEDGTLYGRLWVYRDVTGHKKLEAQLRHSQKMESIGTLAGGVAHDFNNMLAVVQMAADALTAGGGLSPAQAETVLEIGAAAQRAAALTRQLLVFSRKTAPQFHVLDLNKSVEGIAGLLGRVLGENVALEFKLSATALRVRADAGMMDQVLMNLAVNSRDAMPQGGRLVIATAAVEFDETIRARYAQARAGFFACLSVSDTGCGIPAQNLPRIFEPFFTTKEVGKGTGLGLATLFGIVQQHQGWVNVYSEEGRGATFRVYLPLSDEPSAQSPGAAALPAPAGGGETILLVEDDEFLRPFVKKTLTRLGYRVLATANGLEALEVWKRRGGEIHLLLTDMVMPKGITGKDLGERLLREKPDLKVVYASGYNAEIIGKDFSLEEGVNFIAKPFDAKKLAQTIRRRLDAR